MQHLILQNRERRKREQPDDEWFLEIVDKLGEGTIILSESKSEEVMHRMVSDFPVVEWGRLDWSRIPKRKWVSGIGEIIDFLSHHVDVEEQEVYVLWGYGREPFSDPPFLRTTLMNALKHYEELRDYGSDAWLYAPDGTFVVEFYHEGDIVVGMRD
jgi:hypothetical protein